MNSIQWYPGHMAKANRQMKEQSKNVDIIIEIRDARCPSASHNPFFDELFSNKPTLIILNKADLADEKENKKWNKYYKNSILVDSSKGNIKSLVIKNVEEILKDKISKAKTKGIKTLSIKAMVVGIPNVGKSTFINNLAKRKVTKVENKPGVTKSISWIHLNDNLSLMDTPGVLWPKMENNISSTILATLGTINDDILDHTELVKYSLEYIKNNYKGLINKRYDVKEDDDDLLSLIGIKKSFIKNNNVDYKKTVDLILNDIRKNKLGRITYEKCSSIK